MSRQHSLVEYQSPFSIIIIPVMIQVPLYPQEIQSEMGEKYVRISRDTDSSKLKDTSPTDEHASYTKMPPALSQQHLFVLPST